MDRAPTPKGDSRNRTDPRHGDLGNVCRAGETLAGVGSSAGRATSSGSFRIWVDGRDLAPVPRPTAGDPAPPARPTSRKGCDYVSIERHPWPTDPGLEPLLVADPRHNGGPRAGDAVERLGEGGRSRRVPALYEECMTLAPREGGLCIRTPRARLRVPEVVALQHYDRLPLAAVTVDTHPAHL